MKHQILVLVTDPLELKELTQHPDFSEITFVNHIETAFDKLHIQDFDAFLYDDALSVELENKLKRISKFMDDELMLAKKESGESWQNCILKLQQAIRMMQFSNIHLMDDALKNARFNICLN